MSESEFELETEDSEAPEQPKPSHQPVKPLPRLWKTEPDSDDEDDEESSASNEAAKKAAKAAEQAKLKSPAKLSPKASKPKKTKTKDSPAREESSDKKKVLLEETPTLDTYESRRRARFLMGGLTATCVLLLGWIGYRTFLYDPSPIDIPVDDPLTAKQGGPEPKPSKDGEAHFMLKRAQELAASGQTGKAIDMLKQVVKAYDGTPTALEAEAALDRSERNLPLFTTAPIVLANNAKPGPEPAPTPPAVVQAMPVAGPATKGQAALVLPANPAEAVVVPPTIRNAAAPKSAMTTARPLPSGFQPNLEAGIHASGWPLAISCNRDGAAMVLVPGGTFTMGSDDGQPAEKPAHQVKLATFYIDQHEVTNRQFRLFLHEANYHGQPSGKWLTDDKVRAEPETLPITHVSFNDANAYVRWAGKQLPSEAQWEMAARSTDARRFPWGDDPPKWARTARQIDPVMSFPEDLSAYGAYDMAGNVQEWTNDWYDSKYFQQFAQRIAENPVGPTTRPRSKDLPVVVKGGSKTWIMSYREGIPKDKRLAHVGFRCVLSVEAPAIASPSGQPGVPPATAPGRSSVPF